MPTLIGSLAQRASPKAHCWILFERQLSCWPHKARQISTEALFDARLIRTCSFGESPPSHFDQARCYLTTLSVVSAGRPCRFDPRGKVRATYA